LPRRPRSTDPITILVNNAANDRRHETLETDEALWDWSMAVNLRSYFFACQAVIPGMQAAGGGSIINFSSISFMMADTGYASYITANAGIVGMTRTLAREFGPDRIRVNAVAPGWVLTDKQKEMWVTPDSLARAPGPPVPARPDPARGYGRHRPVPRLRRLAHDDLADADPRRGVYLVMNDGSQITPDLDRRRLGHLQPAGLGDGWGRRRSSPKPRPTMAWAS
jgi:NAD(P)-dependent dehydrogenase (short-subunit alcohol dehydrogenase family)